MAVVCVILSFPFLFVLNILASLILLATKEKYYLLYCVIAIVIDPLFFYMPVMDDRNKCIYDDRNLGITAAVIRSFFDMLKIIYHVISSTDVEIRFRRIKDVWALLIFEFVTCLPIPQMQAFSVFKGAKQVYIWNVLVLQYLLRVFRTYYLFTKATRVSGILADATWAIVGFNLLLYAHGGHVFGALWYNYAIIKATACWEKACTNHYGSNRHVCYCDDSLKDYKFLNDFCGVKTGNTTNYDFGLFGDALQSGILEVTDFPKKLLHCLQWGMQNLSGFGQNLKPSTDILENIFAICMTNYGVVLFVFLIGKMQYNAERSQKIRQQWLEVKEWPLFKNMSDEVRGQIKKYKRNKWQETNRVDVDKLVHALPEDLRCKIKRDLCFKLNLLKNVRDFQNLTEKWLLFLCDFMKPVFFMERTRIFREGDPIDEMLFVLKGKLWSYTSRTDGSSSEKVRLKDGDLWGEELIAWAQDKSSSNLPKSTRTIQALSNVEAFTLMADDLKHVIFLSRDCDRAVRFIQTYWRFRRHLRALRHARHKRCWGLLPDKYFRTPKGCC